jgi:hypothetical protein
LAEIFRIELLPSAVDLPFGHRADDTKFSIQNTVLSVISQKAKTGKKLLNEKKKRNALRNTLKYNILSAASCLDVKVSSSSATRAAASVLMPSEVCEEISQYTECGEFFSPTPLSFSRNK